MIKIKLNEKQTEHLNEFGYVVVGDYIITKDEEGDLYLSELVKDNWVIELA